MKKWSQLNDEDLIDQILGGQVQAFAVLVDRHQALVAATVINMVRDKQIADEIGQEAFVKLYENLDQFRGRAKLSTYLTRIAINLSLNYLKRQSWKMEKFAGMEVLDHQTTSTGMAQLEARDELDQALNQLSDNARSVVVLRKIQGFSTKEAADVLNVSEGAVMSRLKRAMDQLKEILTK